jgi:molybdopterin synthase sulfur carrier subunit
MAGVTVTVRLPEVLRRFADGASRLAVELPQPANLGAVLDDLAERFPALDQKLRDEQRGLRRYVNFYVDGEECRRLRGADTPLANATEIQIIPSVAGG